MIIGILRSMHVCVYLFMIQAICLCLNCIGIFEYDSDCTLFNADYGLSRVGSHSDAERWLLASQN